MNPDKPKNLFDQYGIAVPPSPTRRYTYGEVLLNYGIIQPEQINKLRDSEVLWAYIQTILPNFLIQRDENRRANARLLNRELFLDLKDPELEEEIQNYYTASICTPNDSDQIPTLHELAALALKFGLDFAQGKHVKYQFSTNPEDFIVVPLGSTVEQVVGRIMKIFQEALDGGENIDEILALFERLYPHLWRALPLQALENAQRNIRMLKANLHLVAPGTDTPLTIESERTAVFTIIQEARLRIGDQMKDIEAEFATLFDSTEIN